MTPHRLRDFETEVPKIMFEPTGVEEGEWVLYS
jgi:hypothetical protein